MAVLYRGTHRVIVPDGVASDYEADGWSRHRVAPDPAPADAPQAEAPDEPPAPVKPSRPRRKADG